MGGWGSVGVESGEWVGGVGSRGAGVGAVRCPLLGAVSILGNERVLEILHNNVHVCNSMALDPEKWLKW